MKTSPVQKAIDLAGSQTALGQLVGVKQQTVYCWLTKFGHIPVKHVLRLEKLFKGRLTRHEMRPDIYPPE